jgi:histone-lysine N-methyltransferase SETMAR
MDEIWIHIYDPETKEQSKEWKHSGSPCKTENSSSKVLASVFWKKNGFLLVDYLQKGATIMAKYYVELLNKLKQQLVSKRRGKLLKGILFLQHNTAPHKAIMHKKLADFYFEVLKTPAYSPDLVPSDYYILPNLKKHLKGRKFSSTEVTLAQDRWFAAQPKEFFLNGLKKLEQQSHKCVELRGEYVK